MLWNTDKLPTFEQEPVEISAPREELTERAAAPVIQEARVCPTLTAEFMYHPYGTGLEA